MKGMKDINKLISSVAAEYSDEQVINADTLLNQVHESIFGDEDNKQLYLECLAFDSLQSNVNKFFNHLKKKFDKRDVTQQELFNSGLDRLQSRYLTKDDSGTRMLVPLMKMTVKQFQAKIAEHRKCAAGDNTHADQLEVVMRLVHYSEAANDDNYFDVDGEVIKPTKD